MQLSVIVPVYNEAATVAEVVARLQRLPVTLEILLVDDGSTDGTPARLAGLAAPNVRLFRHERNRGKGAAIRTALPHVQGEVVIIQDADLECDPAEIPRLIEPILDGRAEVVYGSRFLGSAHRVSPYTFYLGNRILTWVTCLLTNCHFTDMETAYKVFKTSVIRGLPLRCDRFGFEPEVTVKIAKRRHSIYEMPITYSGRDYAQGKKIYWQDGLKALWYLCWFRCVD